MNYDEKNLNVTAAAAAAEAEQSSTALLIDLPAEERKDYVQLRAMLDSVETTVLAYYLEHEGRETRKQKLASIKSWLIEVVDNCKDSEGRCPRGTYPCGDNWCCSNIAINIED